MDQTNAPRMAVDEAPGPGEVYIHPRHTLSDAQRMYLPLKRLLDILLSFTGLVILAPLFLAVAVIIKRDSKGPVFFRQERIGRNGLSFMICKFRTMRANAEDWKASLSPEEQKVFVKDFKLAADPRVTKTGAFLRKTSLDELPQLVNILKGDLSLIGPRPIVRDELEKYGDQRHFFLSVKPGLTGYWQVNGRNDTTYEERIGMELSYVSKFSPLLDIKIAFLTFGAVIRKTGI
ncbi:MAG: sugar transferase [Oscillospiraceae bacterium]|jgi:lipopolysaccharide/colanic/teichoic acid biosynthesis glycosyltransferase|nr:sugar transferase [Oscillospiraceae bacterium]